MNSGYDRVRSRPSRRLFLKAGGTSAAAALTSAALSGVTAGGQPPTAAAAAPGSYRLGRFLLRLRTGASPTLRIAHAAEPARVIWDGSVAGGFLQGGTAETVVAENTTAASGFTIIDANLVRFAAQSVDSAAATGQTLTIRGRLRSPDGSVSGYTMTWSAVGDRQLRFHLSLDNRDLNRVFLRYRSEADEQFWGFGQQLTFFDQKGRVLPILVQEHGVGRGLPFISQLARIKYGPRTVGTWATTEVSVPQYISSLNRSLMLDTPQYSVFDLSAPDLVEIEQFDGQLTGHVLYGSSPLELVETYTGIVGRMRALPDWVHDGAIVCAQGGTAIVDGLATTLADAQIPVSAFWIQDWTGVNVTDIGNQVQWNWQLDTGHYPKWATLQKTLKARLGARTVLYVNPFLTSNAGHDQLYNHAKRHGYLVKKRDGTIYSIQNASFNAALLDLTNPAARAWITAIIKDNLIGNGAIGWMADFGEALPFDAALYSGEDPADWHNRYPEEWARINRTAITDTGHGTDGLFFSRSGYLHSPGLSTLFWVGDQLQTWDAYDGIKSAITGSLSGGLSGFSHVHSDIGGFDSVSATFAGTTIDVSLVHRTKELFLRWAEHSAFTAVMRTHQGIDPASAWQLDQDADTLTAFRRTVLLYQAWGSYRRELSTAAATTGHPIMRAMALHYPYDAVAIGQQFQYLLGDAMLVAPVTEPDITTADVYLPAGTWYHPWSRHTYTTTTGDWQAVAAPIGQPPLFLNAKAAAYQQLRTAFDKLA